MGREIRRDFDCPPRNPFCGAVELQGKTKNAILHLNFRSLVMSFINHRSVEANASG